MSLNPNHHEPYSTMGDAFKTKGSLQEAEIWYKKCIEVNSQFEDAYFELALMYLNKS